MSKFQAYLLTKARQKIAADLGKDERDVTDEDIAEANRAYRRAAVRRAKWKFGIGCGGLVVLVIIAILFF